MGPEMASAARVAPARRVLDSAERTARQAGHENGGFLSEAAGFMPQTPPQLCLPAEFAAWDEVAAELPLLYGTLGLRRRVDALPNLSDRLGSLPDDALLRAGHVLAMLTHA